MGISVKTDRETRMQFTEFCNSVGLSVSSAINLFMKTVIREKRIPFEIHIQEKEDSEYDEILREFESNPKSTGFGSTEELFDDDFKL